MQNLHGDRDGKGTVTKGKGKGTVTETARAAQVDDDAAHGTRATSLLKLMQDDASGTCS